MVFIQYELDAALYRNVGQYQKVSTAHEKTRHPGGAAFNCQKLRINRRSVLLHPQLRL